MSRSVLVVDYGAGNLGSVISALEAVGQFATIARDPGHLVTADLVVLPGVGAAGQALATMHQMGAFEAVRERMDLGKPTLGICLGAQLFGTYLEEGDTDGLGRFKFDVTAIKDYPYYNNGWCHVDYGALREMRLGRGLRASNTFFFNHRFIIQPTIDVRTVKTVEHPDIPALVVEANVVGVQCHPEKSQMSGRLLLRNILEDYYGL
jgi:imidazole glycerol-phosphate synthase subunit HisH